MKTLRFSTVILSLVLGVLAIASSILLTPLYYGVEKALQYEIQLAYERDQRTLNSLMAAQFKNIQQLSQGMSKNPELRLGIMADNAPRIAQLTDSLLADSRGRYIDALVVEYKDGSSILSSNVSLLGVQLPLKEISLGYNPLAIWTSTTTEVEGKQYSLLHLSLPVVDEHLGEVIGKLHTFVLLNDNYWVINQLQEVFGSQAISLSAGNTTLDGLASQQGQLEFLRTAPITIEKGAFITENSTLREHYLRIGSSDNYRVRSLLSNSEQLLLKNAYITNLYYAIALVVILGITAILVIRYLITSALNQVTQYAEQVPKSGSPSPFKGGRFYEFIRVGIAIEKMLLRIRDRDKHLSNIIDNSPGLIFIKDLQQNFHLVNQRFAEVLASKKKEGLIDSFMARARESDHQVKHYLSSVQYEMEIKNKSNNDVTTFLVTKFPIMDDQDQLYSIGGIATDITQLKNAEQQLEQLALYDSLTGLPNRYLFKQKLTQALNSGSQLITALVFIDLDHFKNINDTYGHSVGDKLLQQVAERLRTCVQAKDTVARLGGDEFTIILRDIRNSKQVKQIAQRILSELNTPYEFDSLRCFSTASLGIALPAKGSKNIDILIRNADQAMYQAKAKGRDVIQFFDAALSARRQKRHHCEEDLHQALNNNEFFLQYQPRFDIEGQKVLGVEALLRWRHPEQGLIPPDEFVPIAETSRLIIDIGRFVLFEACRQAATWNADGYQVPISVNLSPRQLLSRDLVQDISSALTHSGLSAHLLELEITETHIMENINQVLPILEQIRAMGIKFSIDDFGTGYSSLMYLKKLPVDTLKIDRSFIMDIPGETDDENLVRAIISMSHSLNLRVVAEGVENEKQHQFLRDQGCDELQGFLLGKPGSVEQLKGLVNFPGSTSYTEQAEIA